MSTGTHCSVSSKEQSNIYTLATIIIEKYSQSKAVINYHLEHSKILECFVAQGKTMSQNSKLTVLCS